MKIAKEIVVLIFAFILPSVVLSMFAIAYVNSVASVKPVILTIGALAVTAYVAYLRKIRRS